jgi:hypothetical protein
MARISVMAQPATAFTQSFDASRDARLARAAAEAEQATARAQQQLREQAFSAISSGQANPMEISATLAGAGDIQGATAARSIGAEQRRAEGATDARAARERTVISTAAQRVQSARDQEDQFGRTSRALADELNIPVSEASERLRRQMEIVAPPRDSEIERLMIGAGIDPTSDRGQDTYRRLLQRRMQGSGISELAAALVGRGDQNIASRIVPEDVVRRYGQDPSGVYVYETDARGQVAIRRIDDPEARRVSLTGSPQGSGESVPVYSFGANLSDTADLVNNAPPSAFGTPGAGRKFAQDIGQQILGFSGLTMGDFLNEARGLAAAEGYSADAFDGFFDETMTEIDQAMRLLAFDAAAAIGRVEGRALSDRKLQQFREAVGQPLGLRASRNEIQARLRGLDRAFINNLNGVRRDRGLDPIPRGLSWLDGSLEQWDRTGVVPDMSSARSAPTAGRAPRRADFQNAQEYLDAAAAFLED